MKRMFLRFGGLVVPILLIGTLVAFVVLLGTAGPDDQLPSVVVLFLAATVITVFLCVAALWFFIIYDIIHVARNPAFTNAQKVAWICGIWCLNVFVIPFYGMKFFKSDN